MKKKQEYRPSLNVDVKITFRAPMSWAAALNKLAGGERERSEKIREIIYPHIAHILADYERIIPPTFTPTAALKKIQKSLKKPKK